MLDPKLAERLTMLPDHLDSCTLLATFDQMRREIGRDIEELRAAIGLWRLDRRDIEEAHQLLRTLESGRDQLLAVLAGCKAASD